MSKQALSTVALSVVFSILASVVVHVLLNRQYRPTLPAVIRAKGVELIGADGRTRAFFGLAKNIQGNDKPQLVFRDADGRDSIVMIVDDNGNGSLSFASEHWNEGALIVGHLSVVDTQDKKKDISGVDETGAWGLQIRSPQNKFTGVGFFNSGRLLAPTATTEGH